MLIFNEATPQPNRDLQVVSQGSSQGGSAPAQGESKGALAPSQGQDSALPVADAAAAFLSLLDVSCDSISVCCIICIE